MRGQRMSSSIGFEPAVEGGDDPVLSWRYDQLGLLGFGDAHAFLLARSELDLHLMRSLIAAGCPLELAVKIAL
jgi:hypothetical protein